MIFYGLDVHKSYTQYVRMDETGEIIAEGRIPNEPQAFQALLKPQGAESRVALEATWNWYPIYEAVEPWVQQVVLAHPLKTRAIATAKVKTDKLDARILAHLLRTDLLPQAYVPSRAVRDLREQLRAHASIVRVRTMIKNRIHALLAKSGLSCPHGSPFSRQGQLWLKQIQVEMRPAYRIVLKRYLQLLRDLEEQIHNGHNELIQITRTDQRVKLLMTMPGIGAYSALWIIAEIGEIQRFPGPKQLVSYAGLAPRVRASGGKVHCGHITKEGSKWLRWILVEAAQTAARSSGKLRAFYQRVAQRKGGKVAKVALARYMLTILYWMWIRGEAFREAEESSSLSMVHAVKAKRPSK